MAIDASRDRLLRRDIREAAQLLTTEQARFFVDYYYSMQDFRINAGNQVKAAEKTLRESLGLPSTTKAAELYAELERVEREDNGKNGASKNGNAADEKVYVAEPHSILAYTRDSMSELELVIQKVLDDYSDTLELGRWAKSITGIGPVIAAGLLAHIDIAQAPTAGHIWSFAGLNPEAKWNKGEKRPWNAELKVLCAFKIGESFVKVQGKDTDVYGKVYVARKKLEWERNLAGLFVDQAETALKERNFDRETDAYAWYAGSLTREKAEVILGLPPESRLPAVKRLAGEPGSGLKMLPPSRIHNRARRRAVKLFLAHYQHVGWEILTGEKPRHPYVLEHVEGHMDFLGPPNWPMKPKKGKGKGKK